MKTTSKTYTRGSVVVEEIKVGDIHYEYEYGMCVKSEVITAPVKDGDYWSWKSRNLKTGKEIEYGINEKYSHYGPNLYDYEAYSGMKYI